MKRFVMLWVLIHALAGCATERLYVKVLDNEGNPVTNGIVRVGFSTSHVLFGGGNSATSKSGHAEGRTDNGGNAVVKFNCQSSDFGWHVEADGYYRGISHSEHFKFDEAIVPPGVGTVILHEHEKKRRSNVVPQKESTTYVCVFTRKRGKSANRKRKVWL